MGWLSFTLSRLVTSSLFQLLRIVFNALRSVWWEINGTASKLRQCEDPKNYNRSAQVLDVLFIHKFCALQNLDINECLLTHNRFENPQFVIDNEHVTLYTINETSAIFSVARDKNMRLWKTEYNSFIRLAQPIYTSQLIVVPLSVFHRMAETIGDPRADLIFIFNVSRCGSTLLTQIFEYTERCVAISEPDAPNLLAARYRKEGNTPELLQLSRDVIRWDCRPYPSMQPPPLAYVVKITSVSAYALPMFGKLFPNSKKLFMYRDIVKVSKSIYRLAAPLPSLNLAYVLGRVHGAITEKIVDSMGYSGKDFRIRFEDGFGIGVLLSALTMQAYVEMRRDGERIEALRYEDLVARPDETVRQIMEYCGLPVELAPAGARGLEVDSQRNSIVSKSVIGNLKEPELTPEILRRANDLLKKSGLPPIGGEYILEGTFSYKGK